MTQAVTDKDFEQEVINSKQPVLIDFWAEWCGPCRMLSPIIDQLASEMSDTIKIVKMDIVDNTDTPTKLVIRSIPTMMIFKDGKLIDTKSRALPKAEIEGWIKSTI